MISTFGCNNGLILRAPASTTRWRGTGSSSARPARSTAAACPASALVVQAVWASLLCLTGTYGDLLDYVIFAVLIFYILTVAGLFVLRRKRPDAERPYRAFGYPVVPALYVLVAAAIAVDLLIVKPAYTWPGLVIVLLGMPVYFLWTRFTRRDAA